MSCDKLMHDSYWKAPDGTGYNDAPVGFEEITAEAYGNSMGFTYSPEALEFRQFSLKHLDGQDYYASMTLNWFHDGTGTAIYPDISVYDEGYHRKTTLRFFRFGCKHEFRALTEEEDHKYKPFHGNCVSSSICDKCGFIHTVDSSD